MLTEQYRMHSDIAQIGNKLFYDSKSSNSTNVLSCENTRQFQEWQSYQSHPTASQILFIDVLDPVTMNKEVGGFSVCNMVYINAVHSIIHDMRQFGISGKRHSCHHVLCHAMTLL